MKNRILFIAPMIVILMMVGSVLAGPNINPGLWEFKTDTQMQGGANMQIPPETHTQCITSKDLVPMSQDASQECRISNVVTKGNTIAWDIVCGGESGQMTGTGEVTYHGDTMEGTMTMAIAGTNMKLTNHITGRRIGECSESSTAVPSSQGTTRTQSDTPVVEEAITEDAKDVGQAAHDEVKSSTIQEVRKGVRGLFKDMFK